MKPWKFDVKKVSDALQERCPFILFATINGLDGTGQPAWMKNPEISIFTEPGTGTWHALENILPVLAAVMPEVFFDVTLLNRVDVVTRYRAVHGLCLFVREDRQEAYENFVRQTGLDHRIMRARARLRGITDND